MQPGHGRHTGEFGLWLTRYLESVPKYREHIIFYDHGDTRAESNVAQTKGFFGSRVTNANRLAAIDVMVASPEREVIVLVEIEEREVTPKKLLGDVFAIPMCSGFAVKIARGQEYFTICPKTRLILAGVVPTRGVRLKKIREVIGPRLQRFAAPSDAIDPKNVTLIFEGDVETTIEILRREMRDLFPEARVGAPSNSSDRARTLVL